MASLGAANMRDTAQNVRATAVAAGATVDAGHKRAVRMGATGVTVSVRGRKRLMNIRAMSR